MRHISALVALFFMAVSSPASADVTERFSQAMTLMKSGEWTSAMRTAGPEGSVARDVIDWHRLRAGQGDAAEVTEFLKRRPDWPGLDWLRRKSETSFAGQPAEAVLAFFADQPPQTPEGVLLYAEALQAKGRTGEAEASVVLAWRTSAMGSGLHDAYVANYGKLLAPHHAARLDRLLWDGHTASARRMMSLVDDGQQALALARIALQDRAPGVDTLIAKVPDALKSAPGLAHDRFVWRDRKGLDDSAIELLLERSTSAESLGEPAKWAGRRADLARQEMRRGDPARAYRVAARNHLTEGSAYADLEWLAGFLALRHLNDPATALRHFQNFDAAVASPISKGRAGYWLGRAHAALGDADAAHKAYDMGAQFQTSFYGLLAAERIGRPFDTELANPPPNPPWREAAFMQSSVLEASLLFLSNNELNLAERFLTHMVESLDKKQAGQVGDMVLEMGHPHLAVMIGKRAARGAEVLEGIDYPLHPRAVLKRPMAKEMSLAIARRESEFDPTVVSGAGARGLMQVMPATAKKVAEDMGIAAQHETSRLTTDWEYNALLGANYLAGLAATFNGNVVMMSAGYNAGPGRPIKWMELYGDPRDGTPDIVDWIETIPFDETRNYVMRVTESLPVYRARLGQPALPIPFSEELRGSTLRAFAP